MKKIKRMNIAIIGLGNIGTYLYKYLKSNEVYNYLIKKKYRVIWKNKYSFIFERKYNKKN